jgi:hypothetical protein
MKKLPALFIFSLALLHATGQTSTGRLENLKDGMEHHHQLCGRNKKWATEWPRDRDIYE